MPTLEPLPDEKPLGGLLPFTSPPSGCNYKLTQDYFLRMSLIILYNANAHRLPCNSSNLEHMLVETLKINFKAGFDADRKQCRTEAVCTHLPIIVKSGLTI